MRAYSELVYFSLHTRGTSTVAYKTIRYLGPHRRPLKLQSTIMSVSLWPIPFLCLTSRARMRFRSLSARSTGVGKESSCIIYQEKAFELTLKVSEVQMITNGGDTSDTENDSLVCTFSETIRAHEHLTVHRNHARKDYRATRVLYVKQISTHYTRSQNSSELLYAGGCWSVAPFARTFTLDLGSKLRLQKAHACTHHGVASTNIIMKLS